MKTKRILALMIMSVSTATGLWAQIDVHSHAITTSYMDFIKAHGAEMDEGFPIPGWNVEEHLAFMDQAGIETAVLTMPAPQPWFGNGAESAAFCRKYNEECAALKARYPGRFLFCAALPLPDVKRAVEEAVYALDVLHADGVKLATNSYGQYLGDPELESLMEVLNARKAVIITHPHKPSAVNDKLIAEVPLASYEYLAETTRTILNMVAHDVLVRYPDLKVVVPHCGAFLPNALPRFKGLLPVMIKQGYMKPVDVDANISRLYFDKHGYMKPVDVDANVSRLYFDLAGAATDDAVRSLLTITTADHLLYGSDYPYVAAPALVAAKGSLQQRLPAMGLDPQAVLDPQSVLSDNARRLFGADIPVREYGEKLVRLAEIEVVPGKLEEYLKYAAEVGRVSMATEPGVIALFSMQDKADPSKVYILEVYADQQAYQAHIQTAHFRKYKEGTGRHGPVPQAHRHHSAGDGGVREKGAMTRQPMMKTRIGMLVLLLTASVSLFAQKDMALTKKQQALAALAANEAKGNIEGLKAALNEGLEQGLTVSEAKEALSHLYAYTGFPRSLNALGALQQVIKERTEAGLRVEEGREADPLPKDYDALRQGTEVQTQLVGGQPFTYAFAPQTDFYLKAHLFGDIFARNNLTFWPTSPAPGTWACPMTSSARSRRSWRRKWALRRPSGFAARWLPSSAAPIPPCRRSISPSGPRASRTRPMPSISRETATSRRWKAASPMSLSSPAAATIGTSTTSRYRC